jgi:hypothetical protein
VSNGQLTLLVVTALTAHIGVLSAAIVRRRAGPALILNLVVAVALLVALALHPRWLQPPLDPQVASLAAFELLVAAMAAAALWRRYRAAIIGSWVVFALHFAASGFAVFFALTFKISRLI